MAPQSEEAEWWYNAVYEAVQEIPYGMVTSYGHIAYLLGKPQRARQVGICLKHLPSFSPNTDHFFHSDNVPWQRVVNSKGIISPRGPGEAQRQAAALTREGVVVSTGSLGEMQVVLGDYGWFPVVLPSEEGLSSASELDPEEKVANHQE